ncbi:MAG: hypothetical protein K2N87_05015 [Eubacterium sp.]|nr:hypothetical protein [Eubacterium sp.]
MLGKLWKQELKTQGKTVSVMYGVLAAATLLTIVFYYISRFVGESGFGTVFMAVCAIYGITLCVAFVGNFIYLCFHFYQSMYSAQGYLTHTLPLKSTQILHVKIGVSFLYLCLTGICAAVSFLSIGMAVEGIGIGGLLDVFQKAIQETSRELGVPGGIFVLFFLAMYLLGLLNALLLFFAGSSIGQLSHRSKGAYGIAASIGMYYASQIVSLAAVFLGFLLFTKLAGSGFSASLWAMGGASVMMLCWVSVYYTICRVIVQKHLNLE